MTIENAIRILAGSMVLLSILLTVTVHPYWLGLAAFVALNLIQSAFTHFCPADLVMRKVGMKDSCAVR